jgi:hypothetical protein
MVDGSDAYIIRTRESITDLYQHEKLLPESEKVL